MDEGGDVVARETIISSVDASLEMFGVLLGDEKFYVSIDVVLVRDAVIPIYFKDSPIVVNDVLGQHVPWPKVFVLIEGKKKSNICKLSILFFTFCCLLCLHHFIDFFVI